MRFEATVSLVHRVARVFCGFSIFLAAAGAVHAADDPIIISYGPLTGLNMTITGASLGTTSTVDFKVTDQNGNAFVGLASQGTLQVTIAELFPGTDGDPPEWHNYNNRVDTPTGAGPGTQATIIPTTDSGGKLVDHFDGTYTYTFGKDLTAVTTPVAVPFNPALTHRIGIAGLNGTATGVVTAVRSLPKV